MRAHIVDLEWQRRLALRELACALSELKCSAAEVRLERAMRRHALALKYGYDPRVTFIGPKVAHHVNGKW